MTSNISTFVVSRETKGDWRVTDNNGAEDSGFKNWVEAVDFARTQAVAEGATIVRLSSDGKRVVEFLKPRVTHARKSLTVDDSIPAPTDVQDVIDQVDPSVTAEELATLPTSTLVALYNDAGGNIKGKFKGARRTLITKILDAVA